jgi:hypothetical protein
MKTASAIGRIVELSGQTDVGNSVVALVGDAGFEPAASAV